MLDEDQTITSVEDLDKLDETEEKEEEEEDSIEEEETSEDESEQEDDVEESQPKGQVDEITESPEDEDLDNIVTIGKQITEYQKEHPGFDPILLHKDYTKKTQELAELKRKVTTLPVESNSSAPVTEKKSDLSKFRKEDIEYFQELAGALGYAKAEDIEKTKEVFFQQSYELVKREEIKKFLDTHPEYKPENDSEDLRWNAMKSEFDFYKLPEDPHKFGDLLERAHHAVSGSSFSDKTKVDSIIAKKKAAQAGQTSVGGGGGQQKGSSQPKSKKMEHLQKLAVKGGLQGYSQEELEEMFK